MTAFRSKLSSLSDRQLVALILDLCERKLDAEVRRQAAPMLKRKWAVAVNERRKRRIREREIPGLERAA